LYIFLNRKNTSSKVKYTSTIHSYIYQDLKVQYLPIIAYFISKFWCFILKAQDEIVVLTQNAQQYYSKKISTPLRVINNGRSIERNDTISEEDINLITKFKNKNHYILGNHCFISKIKGLDIILKALVNLPEFGLIIIGKGPDENRLKHLCKKLNIEDQVLFLGFRKNVYPYFKYYNLYTLPSKSEGLPLALLEAVSCQIPCIVSDIPSLTEIFNKNELLFFNNENVQDFISQTLKVKDQDLINNYVPRAYRRYIENYTIEIMSENYLIFFKEVTKK